jgi:uncharacterized protein YbbK (DUF523 family)
MVKRFLVSKCLLGENCRYDGKNSLDKELIERLRSCEVIGVCPEALGGLKGKRGPFEIIGTAKNIFSGKAEVLSIEGRKVTNSFIRGAFKTLGIAKIKKIRLAILKSRSPSCSPDFVYNGSFTGKLKRGKGVTSWLLQKNVIKVISNEDFKKSYSAVEKKRRI